MQITNMAANRLRTYAFIGFAFTSLAAQPAFSDDLVTAGHINGPHTKLMLTDKQIQMLDHGAETIALTQNQHQALKQLPDSATVKLLRILPRSTSTCTCELADVAIRIDRSTVEVADDLLGRKFFQGDFRKMMQESDAARKAEQLEENAILHGPHPTPEAVLTAKGVAEMDVTSLKAIEFYKQALQLNPNFKLAKRHLSEGYYAIGHNYMYGKPNFREAVHYLQMSLNVNQQINGTNSSEIKRDLAIANSHL